MDYIAILTLLFLFISVVLWIESKQYTVTSDSFVKVSTEKSIELERNFLFGTPSMLMERVIKANNGLTLSELQDRFFKASHCYHRSIKREYPKFYPHNSQRLCRQ